MTARTPSPVWPPFVQASLTCALSGGFLLGGALFLVRVAGLPAGEWWTAAGQSHGHIQLVGWAGLMVFGVGFHFLPRLRGVHLIRPALTRLVLLLLALGLLLRVVTQPTLAADLPGPVRSVLQIGLVLSGLLEFGGGGLALTLLSLTLRQRPARPKRLDSESVFLFFPLAFFSFGLALAINAAGLLLASQGCCAKVPDWATSLTLDFIFYGFLIPVAAVMSARTFPLYFQTPLPNNRLLVVGLGVLLVGLSLRVAATLTGSVLAGAAGQLVQALALVSVMVALGIFAQRRPLPRRPVRSRTDPLQVLVITAYGWLLITALFLILSSFGQLVMPVAAIQPDAERHALGTGFVSLLILGIGGHLLPGFARQPLRNARLSWVIVILGNLAALLRVGPVLVGAAVPDSAGDWLLTGAGLAGFGAVVLFAVNIHGGRLRQDA